MPLPATRSSELARIAAEAAGADTSTIGFTVIHGPAADADTVVAPASATDSATDAWPTDYAFFSAAGLAMSASTWPAAASTFTGPIQVSRPEPNGRPGSCSYAGLTVPNPGFLKASARRIDVLVTLGSSRWAPSHRDCLMNSLVTERLTALAMERAGGPVLYLHTPVAPFQDQQPSERGDGSSERLRDAMGHCVRMSVGVDPNLPSARLDFEEGLAALAEEFGLGLKLDDRRFNRVRGEWFTIRGFNRERYRQERNRLFPDASMNSPKHALVATVVGQARVGVTSRAISALRASGTGVLAVSVSSMRGINFINLVLPAREHDEPLPPWSGPWSEAVATLADRCAADGWRGDQRPDAENLLSDHKVAVSAPMRCSYPQSSRHTGAFTTGRVPYPLWLRWEVPHLAIQTPALLADIQANLRPYAQQCEVAYAQSRLLRGDQVRGMAKLIVVLDHSHRDHAEAQRLLTDVAERAQEQTLRKLHAGCNLDPGRARLRISPRERWLHSKLAV